jgi:hypothetical protein
MKIVFTPDWFLGSDVLIEGFSFITLFLFFLLSMRSYKLSKNKNSFRLGMGFLFIALAELASVVTKLVLYYDLYIAEITQSMGRVIVSSQLLSSVDALYYTGFFFQKLLTLLGFYIIYRINMKKQARKDLILVIYFLAVIAFISCIFHYYLFHLTVLLLIIFIIENYYKIYKENKSRNTEVVIATFVLLAFSQLIFLFSGIGELYTVIAQSLQLVSYLILLFLIIRILKLQNSRMKNGRKEEK